MDGMRWTVIFRGGAEYIPGAMPSQLEFANSIFSSYVTSHLNRDGISPDDG